MYGPLISLPIWPASLLVRLAAGGNIVAMDEQILMLPALSDTSLPDAIRVMEGSAAIASSPKTR